MEKTIAYKNLPLVIFRMLATMAGFMQLSSLDVFVLALMVLSVGENTMLSAHGTMVILVGHFRRSYLTIQLMYPDMVFYLILLSPREMVYKEEL